jgi:hypothetical protein
LQVAIMTAISFMGRQATRLENEILRVTVLRERGHIAEVFDKLPASVPFGFRTGLPSSHPNSRTKGRIGTEPATTQSFWPVSWDTVFA